MQSPSNDDGPQYSSRANSKFKVIFTYKDLPQPNKSRFSSSITKNYPSSETKHKSSENGEVNNDSDLLFPGYRPVVFRKFTQDFKPRYYLLKLITSHYFEKLSMFVIIVNCITMGMYEPCAGYMCLTKRCQFLAKIDYFIYFFFLFEMLLKIAAMGLVGKQAYLDENWNRLDCFIVCAGALDFLNFSENSGITAIRTIRVLRPLRAINRVPSMRILVTLIIDTLPMLGNVALLSSLIFLCFGIVGVQLWRGLLLNRCFTTSNSTSFYSPEDDDFICSLSGSGMRTCQDVPYPDSLGFTQCRESPVNPFQNAISFDNIGYAFIAVFQVVTLESWATLMYKVQDAHTYWAWIYFILVIIIGSFFLLNMVLVIFSVQFGETKKREAGLIKQERRMARLASSSITINSSIKSQTKLNAWNSLLLAIGYLILNMRDVLVKTCTNRPVKRRREQSYNLTSDSAIKTTFFHVLCCCCFKKLSKLRGFQAYFQLRDKCRSFVEGHYFSRFILGAILINSFFMALEHHGQPLWLSQLNEIINYVFTAVFIAELGLKWFAYGLYGYIKDPLNLFDGFIVVVSIFEIFGDAGSSGIGVLRTFRLLRIFKAFRFIPTLRRQVVVMLKTLDNVATFCCLLLLFIFIFSTLGTHIFGCRFYEIGIDGEKVIDRKNFDSLFWATITVFQILTQSDWPEVMYRGMEKNGPWASLYFIALMIFGNYVLFSLLVAILVEGFSEETSQETEATLRTPSESISLQNFIPYIEEKIDTIEMQHIFSADTTQTFSPTSVSILSSVHEEVQDEQSLHSSSSQQDYSLYVFPFKSKFRQFFIRIAEHQLFSKLIFTIILFNCITLAMERPSIQAQSFERIFLVVSNLVFTVIFTVEMIIKVIAFGLIIGENAYLKNSWNRIDFFLVVLSIVDIFITIVAENNTKILSLLKIMRLLRTLRPLRAINNAPGLKLVVTSLISSLKPIGNTVLICCAFFLIFAILGVQLFSGKLYHCEGPDLYNVTTKFECLASSNNKWVNSFENYDNVFNSLFTLFIISTRDGWVEFMYKGIDAVGVDMQPIKNHNEYIAIFYITYLLVVGFFVVNMFVGVIVDNFHKCRQEQAEEERRLKAEKRARKALRNANRPHQNRRIDNVKVKKTNVKHSKLDANGVPYYQAYPPFKRRVHDFVCSAYFDVIITVVIAVNVFTMTIEFYKMPSWLDFFLNTINLVFTFIFLVEAILRIYSLGIKRYFQHNWNRLDMFIVIMSILAILVTLIDLEKSPIDPTLIRVIRVIRIARVLKLLKTANGIQALLKTVGESLPQVGNLALLFGLLFFIFSTLGVELFGKLTCDSRKYECEGINLYTNFNNFGAAFLTLFRITTGDAWSAIMIDTLKNNVVCLSKMVYKSNSSDLFWNNTSGVDSYLIEVNLVQESPGMCINSILAPFFFIIFVLVAQFVLMNVVIAVLMKQLEDANNEVNSDNSSASVTKKKKIVLTLKKNILR